MGLDPGWEWLSLPGSGQEGIPATSGGDLHAHSSQVGGEGLDPGWEGLSVLGSGH